MQCYSYNRLPFTPAFTPALKTDISPRKLPMLSPSNSRAAVDTLAPGVLSAAVVAIAALFLSQHYGASAMLFALLLGMAMNFLGQEGKCVAGIQFAASTILRIAVALLGLRITFAEISALGIATALMVITAVVLTIIFGRFFVRFTHAESHFGVLTGGAVAICGASAALAIAAVLPRGPDHERDTTFTVIGVTALSTIAMVIYPIIGSAMGFTQYQAGIFLGATIHDVAQVVGAGYSVGKEAGDTATIVKLLRVAMLLPVILVLSIMWRGAKMNAGTDAKTAATRPPLLPWFAVAFGILVALNSFVAMPKALLDVAGDVSRFALVVAIAAIGMRTSLKELTVLGFKPVLLMVAETLFLGGIIIVMMKLFLP
jgi:uncharacterized integral membrane protein (TIGR00698 family)